MVSSHQDVGIRGNSGRHSTSECRSSGWWLHLAPCLLEFVNHLSSAATEPAMYSTDAALSDGGNPSAKPMTGKPSSGESKRSIRFREFARGREDWLIG